MPMLLLNSYSDPLVSVVKVLYSLVVPHPALLLGIAFMFQPMSHYGRGESERLTRSYQKTASSAVHEYRRRSQDVLQSG